MSIEKTLFGSIKITSIVNGHLIVSTYIGYTKAEAIKKFKQCQK